MSRTLYIGLWIAAVLVAIFLLVRFGGSLLSPFLGEERESTGSREQSDGAVMTGNEAPYFELADLAGDRVRLSDFAGTPLIVTFWSGRESDAADQIKIFDDWETSHPDALFKIISINSQEDKSIVKSFIERGAYTSVVLLDQDGAIGKIYGIQTLPTSFFIDGKGILREIYVGIMSQKMIEEKAEPMLH